MELIMRNAFERHINVSLSLVLLIMRRRNRGQMLEGSCLLHMLKEGDKSTSLDLRCFIANLTLPVTICNYESRPDRIRSCPMVYLPIH